MWPHVVLLRQVTVRIGWGDGVLLVFHPTGGAEAMAKIVGVFGVAVAILHAVRTDHCAVETCSQRRGKINALEAEKSTTVCQHCG